MASLTEELLNDKSLLRLVRRNWVNIWSLKSIIDNLANSGNSLKAFQFGKDEESDAKFVKELRLRLTDNYLKQLGINDISNSRLMKELAVLNEGILSGGPVLEVNVPCPEKKCRKVYKKGKKTCPEPIVKNIVKEIYVDRCEGNQIECIINIVYLPKQCGREKCADITAEYCNKILENMESE